VLALVTARAVAARCTALGLFLEPWKVTRDPIYQRPSSPKSGRSSRGHWPKGERRKQSFVGLWETDGATTKALISVLEIEQASSETLEDSHNGQVSLCRRSAERLTGESWAELRLPSRRWTAGRRRSPASSPT